MDKAGIEAQQKTEAERIDRAVEVLKKRHNAKGPLTVDASEFFAAMNE